MDSAVMELFVSVQFNYCFVIWIEILKKSRVYVVQLSYEYIVKIFFLHVTSMFQKITSLQCLCIRGIQIHYLSYRMLVQPVSKTFFKGHNQHSKPVLVITSLSLDGSSPVVKAWNPTIVTNRVCIKTTVFQKRTLFYWSYLHEIILIYKF